MRNDTPCLDENRVGALLGGALDADEVRIVHAHAADCVACRDLLAELAALEAEPGRTASTVRSTRAELPEVAAHPPAGRRLTKGTTVGRYFVLALLGVGAMGVVYEAYDPELDRKVALKLVRLDGSEGEPCNAAQARLLKEARAIARVSHPNVIAVFDAGTYEDRVFVAMELVAGTTLTEWIRERPRSVREILAVFVAAGRGLAAAHASGVVHRDFKPDNVLLGEDGRVRVVDFGLARATLAESESRETPALPSPVTSQSSRTTRTGTILGTPAYMAPEQRVGGPADARADQYSYCVALFEALHGVRPGEPADLARRALRARTRPLAVPTWLRSALHTGLADDPSARHASLALLVDTIERGAKRSQRRVWFGASLAVAVLGGAFFHHEASARVDRAPMCVGAGAELATAWSRERGETITKSFVETEAPSAGAVAAHVVEALDRYAVDWTHARTDACSATRLRGTQSEAVMDMRVRCLDRLGLELGMLTDRLAHADRSVVERASAAVQGLTSPSQCGASRVQSVAPSTSLRGGNDDDPALREGLARATTEYRLRHLDEMLRVAEQTRSAAADKNALRTETEALMLVGSATAYRGEPERGGALLFDAYVKAEEIGALGVEAMAAAQLVTVSATLQRSAESDRWVRLATAALHRAGGDDRLAAELRSAHASALLVTGKFRLAREEAQRSVDALETMPDSTAVLADTLRILAAADAALGESDTARVARERSIELDERELGEGARTPERLLSSALELENDGKYAEAIPPAQKAAELFAAGEGQKRVQRDVAHLVLGRALLSIGRFDDARSELDRITGPTDSYGFSARVHAERGRAARLQQQYAAALHAYRTASSIYDRQVGPRHPDGVIALVGIGRTELERGRPDSALPFLESAVRDLGDDAAEIDRAEARFALAQALMMMGKQDRARDLAREANAAYARAPRRAAEVREVRTWFAQNAPTILADE